jgi:hypothetical protein
MRWIASLVAGLAGAGLLSLIFSVDRARWPHSYYAVGDLTSYRISLHPGRYITFRFVPVALVAVLVCTTADRVGGNALLTSLVLAMLHIAGTAGRASLRLLRGDRTFARQAQAVIHLAVAIGVLAAAMIGGTLAQFDQAHSVVPTLRDIPLALWTAAFAAFSGAYLIQFTRRSTPEVQELMKQSRATIGGEVWATAKEASASVDADVHLAQAILLAENLQRPPWIRRLERAKGRLLKRGTYGVMQIRADHPVDDAESTRLAIEERLRGQQLPREYDARREALQRILSQYNNDPRFIELATAFYDELAPQPEYKEGWLEDFFEEVGFLLIPASVGFVLGVLSAAVLFLRRRLTKNRT